MKTHTNAIKSFTWMMPVIVLVLLSSCAVKKNSWGDPKNGLVLTYRMPQAENVRYDQHTEFTQGMEVQGQKIDMTAKSRNLFSLESKQESDGQLRLNVIIDTMFISFESPRGPLNADMSGVIGKNFELILSEKGRELDYSDAESLTYELGGQKELNVSSSFQTAFPDLPYGPVRVGDTWKSVDTLTERSDAGYLNIITHGESRLENLETFMGFDCIKVVTRYSGTLEGNSTTQGVKLNTTGSIEGTDTWYFAYKEGLFLKMDSEGLASTTTKASGNEELTIPGTRDFATVTELVRP